MSGASQVPRVARVVASLGGAVLAGATRAGAALRPAAKPLHPDGDVLDARVFRRGSDESTGVAWIDSPGQDDATVRVSRATGLPRVLLDVHGLALRVHGAGADGGAADLLFASTGHGRLTRFLLAPSRRADARLLSTLLPQETDTGPLLLGLASTGGETHELRWARPSGPWHPFAELRLAGAGGDDAVSFDPVVHQLRGLRQYAVVRRLREPAYRSARRSRGD